MADGYVTTTTEATIIPEEWSLDILSYVYQNMVMAKLIVNNSIPEGFDTIHYPTYGALTSEAITEGTALVGNAITAGTVDIAIDQQYGVPFTISKKTVKQVKRGYSTLENYKRMAGEAIAYQIDVALLGLYSGLSQTVACTAGLTLAKISDCVEYLDNAGAPPDNRYMVISPKQMGSLRGLGADFYAANYGNPDMIQKGYVGHIYGLQVYVTNNVVTTGSTTTTRHNLVFHKEFAEIDIQGGVDFMHQPMALKVGSDNVADVLYGYGEKRDTFGVTLTTVE